MKTIVKTLTALSLTFAPLVHAEHTARVQPVTKNDLDSAMLDAEREYETVLKEHSEKANPAPLPESPEQKAAKLPSALPTNSGQDILESLASQVDELKNRLIIEKTTLLATQSPRKVKIQGAKTIFSYREEAVYEVTAAVDHVTDLQLKRGEQLTTPPTSGDTVRWNLAVMKSGSGAKETTHIIIKPLDEDIETNLIITTDAHVYHLKLTSGDYHMPAVSWNYPEDNQVRLDEIGKRKEQAETTISPEGLRFTYIVDGDDVPWKPVRVFDDGKKTFIQMPAGMRVSEAPALFLIEDDSDPLVVNYRVKGDYYIVDRLFENAELRVGIKKKVLITQGEKENFFERLFS